MPDAPDSKPLVHRRGPDGRLEVGPDWETLIDRQIREAMEEGQFDNLPYQGEPLPNDDNPFAGDRALAFHVLRNAGVAPPWIEADKDARELLGRLDAVIERAASGPAPSSAARRRDRDSLGDLVTRVNVAIGRLNAEAPTHAQHRRPLALAAVLARHDEACRR
jgi:DnaJ homolog subfamily C member 28